MAIRIIEAPIQKAELDALAESQFGNLVKAVVVEFDSLINIRPSQGNSSRSIEDGAIRRQIREIVAKLVRSQEHAA